MTDTNETWSEKGNSGPTRPRVTNSRNSAKSQYSDCSDQPETEVTRVVTLLGTTIDRVAPAGTRYRRESDRIFKMWGATNGECLNHLPGIVAALRSDVEGEYLQSIFRS